MKFVTYTISISPLLYHLDITAMWESIDNSEDFYPFPSKHHALLYLLINSPRPMVLSQENPNYSFLLPFAQYNLQCPGYYLPVLQGKWVYPHSNSTCRIWNKIISYSAITRDPHRGGWVVGRVEGRQVAFFWRSGKRRCIFFHCSCW